MIGEQRATKRTRIRDQDRTATMLTSFLPSPKRRRQGGPGAVQAARLLLARVAQRISQTFVLSARLQKVQAPNQVLLIKNNKSQPIKPTNNKTNILRLSGSGGTHKLVFRRQELAQTNFYLEETM